MARALHPVTRYARDVLAGKIVAGPLVRLACERHMRDLKDAKAKGFVFHEASADHIIEFIQTYLRLPDTVDENGREVPFILQLWQKFIVGSLFGWRWLDGGHRRFRNAYIETGKGSGKTPLLAAIGHYGLMCDGQKAPEIYSVAADLDQAKIMYRDAVRMVDASPALAARIQKAGIQNVHNMTYGLGFFRPFSREQSSKSGTRPHMGLIDEVHEHPDADTINKVKAGAKKNLDAMFIEITNSGSDRTSVCWQHHEHSRRILERVLDDERWFAYVCALDTDEDPLEDESCWIKVNPNLGVSIQRQYLVDQVSAAKNIPAERNSVLRLNFCVWTQQHTRAIDMAKWRTCKAMPSEQELAAARCFGGVDLGQSDDFSAWIRIWDGGEWVAVKCRFWIPRAALEKYPNRPYDQWVREGWLEITEGDTVDYDTIEDAIAQDCDRDNVVSVAYDKKFAEQMAQHLIGQGIDMVEQPQGFQLTEGIKRKGELIADGELRHGDNPILTWMADNYVVRHGRDGVMRPDKDKASEKIDGQVALDMALTMWTHQPMPKKPAFTMVFMGAPR